MIHRQPQAWISSRTGSMTCASLVVSRKRCKNEGKRCFCTCSLFSPPSLFSDAQGYFLLWISDWPVIYFLVQLSMNIGSHFSPVLMDLIYFLIVFPLSWTTHHSFRWSDWRFLKPGLQQKHCNLLIPFQTNRIPTASATLSPGSAPKPFNPLHGLKGKGLGLLMTIRFTPWFQIGPLFFCSLLLQHIRHERKQK